jgi:CBS domain-containing protein
MNVAHILELKGYDVVTVRREETIADVAGMIARHRIGAVVVTDEQNAVLGILSERDIVRAVAEGGAAALQESIDTHMTQNVMTSSGDETINVVMERMTQGRFRHLPVLKDGKLHGIVSIGDVVKQHVAQIENEASAMRDYIASA